MCYVSQSTHGAVRRKKNQHRIFSGLFVSTSPGFLRQRDAHAAKYRKKAEDFAPFARLIAVSVTSATMQRGSRCLTRDVAREFQRILHILSRHRREDRMDDWQCHTETQAFYLSS
jgi:hypothetical protein